MTLPEEPSESAESTDEAVAALDALMGEFVERVDIESAQRLLKHMPWLGPLDYAVMKAHLIVQAAFADVLASSYDEAATRYLYAARLAFHQYLTLARAKVGADVPDWVWVTAAKLNEARNSLAHHLEPNSFEDAVDAFVAGVANQEPRILSLPGRTSRVCFAAIAVYAPGDRHRARAQACPSREGTA